MLVRSTEIFIVCTGLGRVLRGFESYIYTLGQKLHEANLDVAVISGKKIKNYSVLNYAVPSLHRKSYLSNKLSKVIDVFQVEQLTFSIAILPLIILKRPKAIYLGEYSLYCYLFKFRKYFSLSYKLILYTGGQAVPGLFDPKLDYVHHVTDIYVDSLTKTGVSADRQFLLPHFIHFSVFEEPSIYRSIKRKANGKLVVLSVGLLDNKTKGMYKLLDVLSKYRHLVFPILLGERTNETYMIVEYARRIFGYEGYFIGSTDHNTISEYYKAADLFIMLSKKESFGLVFLEAMFYGKPVICRDFHELRFVLQDKVVYCNDSDISHNVQNVLESVIPSSSSILLREYVEKNYSWPALGSSYINMFKTFLSN